MSSEFVSIVTIVSRAIFINRSFQLRRAAARYPQSGIRIPDCGYRTAHFVADAARAAFSQKSQPGRILHVWRPTARAATPTAFVTIDSHSDELSASSEASKPLRSGCPRLRRVHATCKRSQDLVRLDAMVSLDRGTSWDNLLASLALEESRTATVSRRAAAAPEPRPDKLDDLDSRRSDLLTRRCRGDDKRSLSLHELENSFRGSGESSAPHSSP